MLPLTGVSKLTPLFVVMSYSAAMAACSPPETARSDISIDNPARVNLSVVRKAWEFTSGTAKDPMWVREFGDGPNGSLGVLIVDGRHRQAEDDLSPQSDDVVVLNTEQLEGSEEDVLFGLSLSTGEVLWRREMSYGSNRCAPATPEHPYYVSAIRIQAPLSQPVNSSPLTPARDAQNTHMNLATTFKTPWSIANLCTL